LGEKDVALHGTFKKWVDSENGDAEYGDYIEDAMEVQSYANPNLTGVEAVKRGFVWDDRLDTVLREADFRLSRANRAIVAVEHRLAERWRRSPRVMAIVGFVLAYMLGLLTEPIFDLWRQRRDAPPEQAASVRDRPPTGNR
jgi:hypothetical protein